MKYIIILFLVLLFGCLSAQEKETKDWLDNSKISIGVGPMNISEYSHSGISMNTSFDYALKKWLYLSANVNIGKSGKYETSYTYFKFYPDFPEDFETNFIFSDRFGNTANSFSALGFFVLLNPGVNKKLKLVFGPGISYVSWQEITTSFLKEFKDFESYTISNRVSRSKKLDPGIRISLERHFNNRVYVGLNFQGYTVHESASSLTAILGFQL